MRVMTLSLREARMVLERLVLVAGIDAGLVPSLRECALFSAALGPAGFEGIEANMNALRGADPKRLKMSDEGGRVVLDGHGLHAWFGIHPLVDLLCEQLHEGRSAKVRVTGFAQADELAVAAPIGLRQGISVAIRFQDGEAFVTAQRAANGADPVMDIILNGTPVNAELWWRLFDESDKALAPDSFESRRHAGALIVEADGRVIGRQDEDDTDLSMLTGADKVAAARENFEKAGQS